MGLNPHCDLDLEDSNPKLSNKYPACGDALLHQDWLQKVQRVRRLLFENLSPHCDLDLEDRNPNCLHDTQDHDDTPTYQASLRNGKWFRRYHPDKYSVTSSTFTVTLTLRTAIQKCSHNSLARDVMHQVAKVLTLQEIWMKKLFS